MVCIVSKDATYGNCAGLAKAIGAKLTLSHPDKKDMYKQHPAVFGYKKLPEKMDTLIIVGAISFDEMLTQIPAKIRRILKSTRVKIILTDSFYLNRADQLNKVYDHLGIDVYCMPQLLYLRHKPTKPYYQPFDLADYPIVKNDELTVCHTPFHRSKLKLKGSDYIKEVVSEFPVRFEMVMNKTWHETLEIRAASHITIDAIIDMGQWYNGVGKSGLEALWLGSAVITSGKAIKTDYFNDPPVLYTTVKDFRNDLSSLVYDEGLRHSQIEAQRDWAKKYTSYEFVSKHVML